MNASLAGFFSGFPERKFTEAIAEVLKEELTCRKNLVFISCEPDRTQRNDEDAFGMHNMFAEYGMPFENYCVIDGRYEEDAAKEAIRSADCIFLMGGNATKQMQQIKKLNIKEEILKNHGVILGVSAGAMNMGGKTVDIYETTIPYEGLGFADVTVKAHYPLDDAALMDDIRKVSMVLPVTLMTDESAIFVREASVTMIGEIHQMIRGELKPLSNEALEKMKIR